MVCSLPEALVDRAAQQFETPVAADVVGGLRVRAVLKRAARGDHVATRSAREQLFVVRVRLGAEQYLARLRRLLEPRRHVDGVAG